jgi:predicted kinase
MPVLYAYRGLPGSGKSTHAAAWVAQDPARRARVNRDSLRRMLHGGHQSGQAGSTELQVTAASHAAITALLQGGRDVACDDTNLRQRVVRELADLARRAGADFTIRDFTDVALQTCIDRDAARDRTVGEAVIRDMHTRYLRGRTMPLPSPQPAEPLGGQGAYTPAPATPAAVLVDIDGTVALMHGRSPYEEALVGTDQPNQSVITVVRALRAAGHRIVFMSGRTDGCRAATEQWLDQHVLTGYDALFMRRAGDQRRDAVVKAELFDTHIRHAYTVTCVLDDRAQVVAMWRALGLTVLQVADGDF